MSDFDLEKLNHLFSQEKHYQLSGKVFDEVVHDEVMTLSERAYAAAKKTRNTANLSPSDNVVYLSLLETWLASGEPVRLETNHELDFATTLTVGEQEPIALPTHRTSVRWIIDVFLLGCQSGPAKERQDFEQFYRFESNIPLLGQGDLSMSLRDVPDEEAKPYSPDMVNISAPQLDKIKEVLV